MHSFHVTLLNNMKYSFTVDEKQFCEGCVPVVSLL